MAMPTNDQMARQMAAKPGFIAALDQSGGSTPGALRRYGIPDDAYSDDAAMFRLVHEMRVRIITAPAFSGDRVIGAILFEVRWTDAYRKHLCQSFYGKSGAWFRL